MLKLLDITKEYIVEKESTLALRGVSIEFRKNEFVSILGPSGCGKTTLLNIIGGLDRYTSGDIQIDGISTKQYDDVDWDTYRNRKIGFVFQSYNLIPHMNILKNVAMGLTLAGVEREERKKRALEALRKVGLENQARKRPNQLSGGQMQRVAIARALVNNPDIILADEPTGALDSESGVQVMDLLKEVAEDRLVIMVTHNPMLAEEYSTRIVYLKDGEVEGDTMPYSSDEEFATASKSDSDGRGDVTADVDEPERVIGGVEDEIRVADVTAGETVREFSDSENTNEGVQMPKAAAAAVAEPRRESECAKRHKRLKEKLRKRRQLDKSAMKLSTAISLSWNNLLSKKGRTFLTSIAGSIGIIGIILVLSLSTGARMYIHNLEESALSTYPLTVNKSTMDVNSLISIFMQTGSLGNGDFDEDTITTQEVLGQILKNLGSMMDENDLHSFKKYIDEKFDSTLASVKFNYGTTFNAYALDPNSKGEDESEQKYMKINPYSEMMYTVFDEMMENPLISSIIDKDMTFPIFGQNMTLSEALGYMGNMLGQPWAEISDNHKLLDNQYDLVGNSRWPEKANEVVITVNENNSLLDYQLFMLGLKSTDDVIKAIMDGDAFSESVFEVNELIGKEYKIMTNSDYLEPTSDGANWIMHNRKDLSAVYVDENAMTFADGTDTVKVVGVVRPKPGVVATSITGVIGYPSSLTDAMLQHSAEHPAVKAMTAEYERVYNAGGSYYESLISFSEANGEKIVEIGDKIFIPDENNGNDDHSNIMRKLGFVDKDYPISIDFYCTSFDAKEEIVSFIKQYESESESIYGTEKTIKYTDTLSSMMSFVNTMADTITGVLVAFAAISLIVSTIMIAIIIYTSVLERRKEIGVLRSIGARKKDISRVFLAESAILGGYSGLIGIIVSTIISFIGSAILRLVFNIEGLMQIEWWHCLLMLLISILLSMLAGFIPARIASKKDPAIALRSE